MVERQQGSEQGGNEGCTVVRDVGQRCVIRQIVVKVCQNFLLFLTRLRLQII